MLAPFLVFLLVVGFVLGGYVMATRIPASMARRRLEERLQEVAQVGTAGTEESVVAQQTDGPLPGVDKFVGSTNAGSRLARLIEQSGVKTTPSTVLLISALLAVLVGVLTYVFARYAPALFIAVPIGGSLPFLFLSQKRTKRMRAFEERFPEALDLVSRAIRAGHAFQTALGMVAEELSEPVGPEFKKVFDQQNFGLPLRDALAGLAERVPLVDVKFFVTAVSIQRESGGNLAEILDNLSHVVRERFKIMRQVRVHTAHGRITGWVLLALPAFLAVALSIINADHMRPLFQEPVGQMLIGITIVMQIVGYFWIRRVIKIEV